jgi:hypothetical protein
MAVFFASLLGSLHCAGMCGPFVAFATLRVKGASPRAQSGGFTLQFAYHTGRLLAYAILGALAGALGATLNLGGSLVGIGRLAGLLAGILLILVGITRILSLAGARFPTVPGALLLRRAIALGQATASRYTPLHRAWAIGLLTAVLPCGWLYAFVAVAAGTGNAFWGMATMVVFWSGTVPILAGIGAGLGQFLTRAGRTFQVAIAVVVIGLGLSSIVGRWTIPPGHRASPTSSLQGALQRVAAIMGQGPHQCH